jgi:hypothetical protein
MVLLAPVLAVRIAALREHLMLINSVLVGWLLLVVGSLHVYDPSADRAVS